VYLILNKILFKRNKRADVKAENLLEHQLFFNKK